MSKIAIIVEVDDAELEDPNHPMGVTEETWQKLTGAETGSPELSWLGEITDVRKEQSDA